MKVTSEGIKNGIIDEKYGKKGIQFNAFGVPTYSLPIKIEDAPRNTVSFALVLKKLNALSKIRNENEADRNWIDSWWLGSEKKAERRIMNIEMKNLSWLLLISGI